MTQTRRKRLDNRSRQDVERYYFELFRRDFPLPEGLVTYGDKPDVRITGQRTIGIEITNFFLEDGTSPSSEQVQRRRRDRVVSRAQKLYLAGGGRRVEIWLSFDNSVSIQHHDTIVENLVMLARRVEKCTTGVIDRALYVDIPELSFVYLNTNLYPDARWHVSQCYSGQNMSAEKLREIIRAKEKKSEGYQPCDEYWLLVIVDFIDPAQDQEIPESISEKISSAVFEKVIIYKTCFGQVLELN